MREYLILDVFTDIPLQGNPVAVFTDGEGLSTETMQAVARELNLSETVFLLPGEDGAHARVRIFTPAVEMPFAGHPVLGTAFMIAKRHQIDTVRLLTGAGVVAVSMTRREGAHVYGEMDQPLPTWELFAQPDELLAALGVASSRLPIEVYTNGPRHTYVALPDVAAVSAVRPDFGRLADLGEVGVSCFAVAEGHVRTRMFGPGLGVAEDPATGSAAGPLSVHLVRHGEIAYGERILIRQGAEIGRPSTLYAITEGTRDRIDRVGVGGSAVIVGWGELKLD